MSAQLCPYDVSITDAELLALVETASRRANDLYKDLAEHAARNGRNVDALDFTLASLRECERADAVTTRLRNVARRRGLKGGPL